MNILYDIIHILPLSVLLVNFFGRFTGMPESNFIGYIVCLALPLWIIILRQQKEPSALYRNSRGFPDCDLDYRGQRGTARRFKRVCVAGLDFAFLDNSRCRRGFHIEKHLGEKSGFCGIADLQRFGNYP